MKKCVLTAILSALIVLTFQYAPSVIANPVVDPPATVESLEARLRQISAETDLATAAKDTERVNQLREERSTIAKKLFVLRSQKSPATTSEAKTESGPERTPATHSGATAAPQGIGYKHHTLRMAVSNLISGINDADNTPAYGRYPVPSASDINKAFKDIQDIYAKDLSKTNAQEIQALAQALTSAALAAGNTEAQVYALLFEAARQSVRGENYDHANKAIFSLLAKFNIAPSVLLTSFAQELQNQTAVGNELLYVGWLNYGLLYQAWTVSNFEVIARQAMLLEKLQGQINDEVFKGHIGQNLPKVQEGLKVWQLTAKDREQLKTDSNNLTANLALAKYYLYHVNRVDLALPYMAKSGDIDLVKLADIERNAEAQVKTPYPRHKTPVKEDFFTFSPAPTNVRPYLACADAWLEYGAKATPEIKQLAWTRAAFLYDKISRAELGLDSAKAMKKYGELLAISEQEGWKKNDKTILDPIMGNTTGNRVSSPLKFCGVESEGTRIVYILDHSGSLVDNFDFLRQEVLRSVKRLDPTHSFAVIAYSEDAKVLGPEKLQEANPANKAKFKDAIDQIRASGFNDDQLDPFETAFRKAFAMKPDTIYFLTDGAFDPKLAGVIQALNKDKQVTINTLAFIKEDPKYNEHLRKLAADNKGQYKLVKLKDLR